MSAAELWRPASGCGPWCLRGPAGARTVSPARRAGRLLAVVGMLLVGVGLAAVLPVLAAPDRRAVLGGWARGTLRAFGVRLAVHGRLPRRRALLVANHVSWLDILAVLAVAPARLVAKREVRDWPGLGPLAAVAGTVFVDRGRPRDLPATVGRVAAALRAGHPVAVFPEGTTWCGAAAGCRPARGFRPAMFQAAVDAGAPVVPLRLDYRYAGDRTTLAAFLGEETLWQSVRRVLAAGDLTVSVRVAGALHPAAGADRRVLARAAESAVADFPVAGIPAGPAMRHAEPLRAGRQVDLRIGPVRAPAPADAFVRPGGDAVESSGGVDGTGDATAGTVESEAARRCERPARRFRDTVATVLFSRDVSRYAHPVARRAVGRYVIEGRTPCPAGPSTARSSSPWTARSPGWTSG